MKRIAVKVSRLFQEAGYMADKLWLRATGIEFEASRSSNPCDFGPKSLGNSQPLQQLVVAFFGIQTGPLHFLGAAFHTADATPILVAGGDALGFGE